MDILIFIYHVLYPTVYVLRSKTNICIVVRVFVCLLAVTGHSFARNEALSIVFVGIRRYQDVNVNVAVSRLSASRI